MKTIFKCSNHFWFALALCVMILSGCSCSAPKPTPDPLAGWQMDFSRKLDPSIEKDYQDYIQTLSPEEKQRLGPAPSSFFKDDAGQHAIEIKIGINGTVWEHILIYDKNNKRIKTIKYSPGGYRS